jgi:hypothetical protein
MELTSRESICWRINIVRENQKRYTKEKWMSNNDVVKLLNNTKFN